MKLDNLIQKFKENSDAITKIVDEHEELTDDQQEQVDKLSAENDKLNKQIEACQKAEKQAAEASRLVNMPAVKLDPQVPPSDVIGAPDLNTFKIPAQAKRHGQLKAFKGDAESAYRFGQWFKAVNGSVKASEFCNNHGIPVVRDVQVGEDNTRGGYLVPVQFDNRIIEMVLEYGAFRRNAEVVAMSGDTLERPRSTSGLTASWTAESSVIDEDDKTWDQVTLTAKKLGVIARISNELSEDAIINVADNLAVEMARAFALAEDTAGFSGTGAAATGGIVGVRQRLSNVYGNSGLGVLDTGQAWAGTTLAHHNGAMALLPAFAWSGPRWYCNPAYFHAVMSRLAYAAGGNTTLTIGGQMVPAFLGYPVEFVNALPASTGDQFSALFGDLSMAAMLGDRRQTTIAVSDSASVGGQSVFERDQIAIRATQRIDINVHSVGDGTLAGPVIAIRNNA